jgi:hypothetical protein
MTITQTKTYKVTVIERALAFYEVKAEDAGTAAENWQDGEFKGRDDEALDCEGPSSVRERKPDGTWRKISPSEWSVVPDGTKPYSVLLLYPDYANDSGTETFYALVLAAEPTAAVNAAQRQASISNPDIAFEPDDFAPLLVTEGHHYSEPLFNK